jgi:long-subunit acyl-CoA synthetase (AMP-forming)
MVRQRVREQLMLGASQIKLTAGGGVASPHSPLDVSTFTLEELKAAVDAAGNWGSYVTVHAYTPAAVRRSIDAGVKVIVTTHDLNKGLKPSRAARLEIDGAQKELDTKPDHPVISHPGPEELTSPCYVIYTSGSTGHPKGVLISHRNVRTFAAALHTE